MFRVCGRLLAKALLDKQLVAVSLNWPLLKHILGLPVAFSDLEMYDADLHKNLTWILNSKRGEVEYLYQTFTASEDDLGASREVGKVESWLDIDIEFYGRIGAYVQGGGLRFSCNTGKTRRASRPPG